MKLSRKRSLSCIWANKFPLIPYDVMNRINEEPKPIIRIIGTNNG